jgi:hypothetical protein
MNRDPTNHGPGHMIGRAEIYLSLVDLACPNPTIPSMGRFGLP